jgi:4-amino-4-deoxy-L-arabinose transferase-like glycosyltransferase
MALPSTQSIAITHRSAPTDALIGAALLIAALFVYGRGGVTAPLPETPAGDVQAQARLLVAHGGRDNEGRALPLFVHIDQERWLPVVPILTTAVLIKLAPGASNQARWAATALGALDVVLLYVLVLRLLRRRSLAIAAALVLLATPVHAQFSRTATTEGIWPLPFIIGWAIGMTALVDPPTRRARWTLAAGMASLMASAYTQPSAALMTAMFIFVAAIAIRMSDGWRVRDLVPAVVACVILLLPFAFWFARFPSTYTDTFGRWVVHRAHLRDPLVWLQALVNHQRVGNVASLFSDFFSPSHLFLTPGAPGFCGFFLSPFVIPLAVGIYRQTVSSVVECTGNVRCVLLGGCIVGPLAAAMFEHARSTDRGLSIAPFAVTIATIGGTAMAERGGRSGRVLLVLAAAIGAGQAAYCLR